jgi:hypothetical protein
VDIRQHLDPGKRQRTDAVIARSRLGDDKWSRGYGVAILLKIYAHCIDGQADAANQHITDALGNKDTQPEPGGEEDGEGEMAS